jgi:glyoxylate reductase
MARILVTRPLPEGGDEPLLRSGHDIVRLAEDGPGSPAGLTELAAAADGMVCMLSDRIDRALLQRAGGRLRVVATVSVGYDNVDVGAAAEAGVVVCHTPGVLDDATADVAFLLLLAAARRATEAEADLRAGRWPGWGLTQYLGKDLAGGVLGLVGFGRIGRALAGRAAPFGLTVKHHTRSDTGLPGWTADLDTLLAESNFVSLHVPLSPATRHLIDRRRLALMRPGAVLINTARGPLVDEEALAEALERGTIFAAGLDVFEREPAVHPRLLAAPRTVLLPHVGSATERTRRRMAQLACQGVTDVLAGRPPAHSVAASLSSPERTRM